MRQERGFRCRMRTSEATEFMPFSLSVSRLSYTLGPANPRLTAHRRGTLALSAVGVLTQLSRY